MRNLAEYPITKQELVDYLKRKADEEVKKERIGDMGPILLTLAAAIIEPMNDEAFNDYIKFTMHL